MCSPALAEDEQRKRRRNKKERGGSLFSLRKKKDKKEGVKGLAKVRHRVPDPKLSITDPDPPVGNQEFRIRILETIQLRIRILELQIDKETRQNMAKFVEIWNFSDIP